MTFTYEEDDLRDIADLMDALSNHEQTLRVEGERFVIERHMVRNYNLSGKDAWVTSVVFHEVDR